MPGKNFSCICMALHLSGLLVTFRAPISSVKRTPMSAASGRLLVSSELINTSVPSVPCTGGTVVAVLCASCKVP